MSDQQSEAAGNIFHNQLAETGLSRDIIEQLAATVAEELATLVDEQGQPDVAAIRSLGRRAQADAREARVNAHLDRRHPTRDKSSSKASQRPSNQALQQLQQRYGPDHTNANR